MKLFDDANAYLKKSDWKDLALVKLCLCSIGIMIGMSVNRKTKKFIFPAAAAVFTATYIPLMTKFLKTVREEEQKKEE